MCGIVGTLLRDPSATADPAELRRMLDCLVHRGPDGQGIQVAGGCGLGHCRLSIIDLVTGNQPMCNEDQTIWVVYNGEIYNFREMRDQLVQQGHVFHSRSDTEVILHAYEELGVDCVQQLRGMFAFAIWDQSRKRLFIARDRLGIKPLYYCQTPRGFHFASELKAFLTLPDFNKELDLESVRAFLSFYYLPGEKTLFKSVRRLLPGHWLMIEKGSIVVRQYWDLDFEDPAPWHSLDEAAEALRALLAETVKMHMVSDVPVGVLLSGGLDSSAMLALAASQTGQNIKTFTVGFSGSGVVDERPYARLAATKYQSEHFETSLTKTDFFNFLPEYVWHMEDPVCEPPAVALHQVAKLARQHVKVLISGEGGDEGFAGYPNYPNMLALRRFEQILGSNASRVGGWILWLGSLLGMGRLQRYGRALGRRLEVHYFSRTASPRCYFIKDADGIFDQSFLESTQGGLPQSVCSAYWEKAPANGLLNRMLYMDIKTWLPDDLLIKADKMTMLNSLELRVPLLDHLVIQFAARLPVLYRVCGRETKRALRLAFSRQLPAEIIRRKKAGFPVPYSQWLRDRHQNNPEEMLLSQRALQRGIFRPGAVRQLLELQSGTGQYAKEVFCLIVLELWFQRFLDKTPAA